MQLTIKKSLILVFLFAMHHFVMFAGKGQQPILLFSDHTTEKTGIHEALHFFDQKDVVIRFGEVEINDRLSLAEEIKEGNELLLNLFDDVSHSAIVSRVKHNVNGTHSLTAIIQDTEAYLVLVTTAGRSLGTVYLPSKSKFYKITSCPETHRHFVIEMDARDRDILEGSPPLLPDEMDEDDLKEQERIRNSLKDQAVDPMDWVNIDVMVLYTPRAAEWADQSGGGIENVVAIAMANAQLVLDNSETRMAMTLVHSGIYSFQESGNTGSDLGQFTNSPVINGLRNEHRADLVAVFARVGDTGGVAWLLTNRFGEANRGFSVTRVQQAATSYTHIHEMGHNMGCHHHKDQNFQPGPTYWDNWPNNLWSAGWRWQGADGNYYCSVMTYTAGQYYEDGITHTEVPYFSSPELQFAGVPTGHPFDGDNARTLREIKHVIATYRESGTVSLYTKAVSDIGLQSAVSGGIVFDDGGEQVTQRGLVWSALPNPTLDDHSGMTNEGGGVGTFTSVLTGLQPSTTHYVVAYAQSEAATVYGPQRVFDTQQAIMATVRTNEPELISYNAAVAGGDVTQGGNSEVTERGVVWNTQPNPSLTNNMGFTKDGIGTGLKPETTYYYRAYATNLAGTNYGSPGNFTTLFARLYPNPFKDRLHVEFYNESREKVDIVLTDTRGNVVKRRPVRNEGDVQKTLNVAHLSGGIYLLSIESEFKFPVWQLLKLHE